jgi:hypothetical protein
LTAPVLIALIVKIGELNQHLGLTVLMLFNYYNLANRTPDRGYIIVHGEIVVAADSVDELRGNDIVKRALSRRDRMIGRQRVSGALRSGPVRAPTRRPSRYPAANSNCSQGATVLLGRVECGAGARHR